MIKEIQYYQGQQINKPVEYKGQFQINGKCYCKRCHKKLAACNFYSYKDGSKYELCKPCVSAHIDNFDSSTFEWILKQLDVPYIPSQWNVLRDRAFARDPQKMNGLSVIGKYLAKMKLRQFKDYNYADSKTLQQQIEGKDWRTEQEAQKYDQQLKEQFERGQISQAQYRTLVRTQTLSSEMAYAADPRVANPPKSRSVNPKHQPLSSAQAMQVLRQNEDKDNKNNKNNKNNNNNPYLEQNFIQQTKLPNPADDLTQDDKVYLAIKWGRLYTPNQWVSLEKMYTQFMDSFDIQGAARIDTLKMICKTSLKMNQAIDCGDIDTYQKLSRVYDSMMKSAKFTQAQNKQDDTQTYNSVSALVDLVQSKTGQIPRYDCKQPRDIIDQIIYDLKEYTKNLIYEDKSLAREIEDYLQDKRSMDAMMLDKMQAKKHGFDAPIELQDEDYIEFRNRMLGMQEHDEYLTDQDIEEDYQSKMVQPSYKSKIIKKK